MCSSDLPMSTPVPSLDDHDGKIWLDGQLVDWRKAKDTDVSLRVLRDGQEKTLNMRIGSQPKDLASGDRQKSRSGMGSGILDSMGLSLQDLSDDVARQFGYDKNQGVLIASVEPDSVAEAQVIFDVNLNVPFGEIFGLLGSSGCGKTTLIKMTAGILRKDSGNYEIGRASCRERV